MCNQTCNQGRECTCGPRSAPKWYFLAVAGAGSRQGGMLDIKKATHALQGLTELLGAE